VVIRQALPGDGNDVRALVDAAYRHYVPRLGIRPGPMRDDYDRRIADRQAWVDDENGTIIGLVVLEDQPEFLLLGNVAVAPAAQGQGRGRVLIAFAEHEARQRGYTEIRLYTHERMVENIALYQRLGFHEIRRVHEKGYDRVYMAKDLREHISQPNR
jgi:ribosomal protein S18 acetylase RimI-like enzyme